MSNLFLMLSTKAEEHIKGLIKSFCRSYPAGIRNCTV